MFKKADPTRRTPTWLQAHTKENAIWQLKMLVLVFIGVYVKEKYEEWKLERLANAFDE